MAPARRRWRSPRRRRRRPRRPRRGARRRSVDDQRHVVIVTDRPDLLAQRTGPVRRFIGAAPSVAVLVALPPGEAVPAMCRSALTIGSIGVARWWPDTRRRPTRPRRCTPRACRQRPPRASPACSPGCTTRRIPRRRRRRWPRSIGIGALNEQHGAGPIDDPIAVAAGWRNAGPDPAPAAAIGLTTDGVVEIDLARDGPHALIAGTTGSGKSELLRTLVVCLAARSSPDHLTFVLVDYKGGSTFDACAELPHTVGLVTDLDDHLAERALVSLDAEIRRRERLLRAAGAEDLAAYRGRARTAPRCLASPSWSTSSPPWPPTCRHSSRRSSPWPSAVEASASTSCWPPSDPPASSARASAPTPTSAWPCGCRTPPTGATSSVTTSRRRSRAPRRVARCCDWARARRSCSRRRAAPGPSRHRATMGSGSSITRSSRAARTRELAVLVRSIRNAAALSDVAAAAPPVAAAAARPALAAARRCPRPRGRAGRTAARRPPLAPRRRQPRAARQSRVGDDDGAAVADRRRLPRHRAVADARLRPRRPRRRGTRRARRPAALRRRRATARRRTTPSPADQTLRRARRAPRNRGPRGCAGRHRRRRRHAGAARRARHATRLDRRRGVAAARRRRTRCRHRAG